MRGKLIFGAGAAIGYLLGTRAGRERFDQITGQAKRFWESNTVQEAAGVVQTQAGRLYDESKKMVADQAHKMSEHRTDKYSSQNRQLRKRGFAERNRKAPPWGAPAPMGVPANPPTPPASPY